MRVSRHLPSDHHRNNFRFRGGWDHELQMVLVLVAITCVAIVSWGTLDVSVFTFPKGLRGGEGCEGAWGSRVWILGLGKEGFS